MSFFSVLLAWLVIAAILVAGIVLAVTKGGVWLLAFLLPLALFVFLFGKHGCASH